MNGDQMPTATNSRKPTTFQLLGDAFAYARPNFATFLLYGGGLILASKLAYIAVRWVQYDREILELGAFALPIFLLTVFLNALFAFNVHRYILLGQRRFSFALNKIFWLFFAAVLAIQLAFLIPGMLLENYISVEQIIEWRRSQSPLPLSTSVWFLLVPAAEIVAELLAFMLIAIFLTIPPSIVAHGKVDLSANLKIGRALYWPIFSGLVILYVIYSLYAVLVGGITGMFVPIIASFDDAQFALATLTLQSVLLAPINFFYVLLGATFTSAALIHGSGYLGLPDPVRSSP